MKRILQNTLIIFCLCLIYGCAKSPEIKVHIKEDEVVELKSNQILSLEFDSNATTGYTWVIASPGDKTVLRKIGKDQYIQDSDRVGSGGIQIFRFEALKKGTTEIVFEYRRTWEEMKPAKQYKVKIIVYYVF